MAAADRTLIIPARREFKYLVPRRDVAPIRDALAGLCDPDQHNGPDGTYLIRSLYLDTRDLQLFSANEREAPRRFKARVRGYPEAPGKKVFVEIKNRHGDVIRKTRAGIPRAGWGERLRDYGGGIDDPDLDAFLFKMHRYGLRPQVLVQYKREAWVSRLNDYARISIDGHVECQQCNEFTLEANEAAWRPIDSPLPIWLPESTCIIELKWADMVPRWMMQIVQRFELLRHAFSKYCYSMEALSDDHYRDYRRSQTTSWS